MGQGLAEGSLLKVNKTFLLLKLESQNHSFSSPQCIRHLSTYMIYVKAFLLFLIISQDFKPKQKKGKNNKDASVWDGEDTPPCLLHLYLEESFFCCCCCCFFFLIKGKCFPSLATGKKKRWMFPWVKFLLEKQITKGGLWFEKRLCKFFPERSGLLGRENENVLFWGEGKHCVSEFSGETCLIPVCVLATLF